MKTGKKIEKLLLGGIELSNKKMIFYQNSVLIEK